MTRAVGRARSGHDLPEPGRRASDVPDLHHGSHDHLLTDGDTPDRGGRKRRIDAVVVPTFRPHHALRDALTLAQELDCLLVALCSGPAQAQQAVDLGAAWGDESGVQVVAVDLHETRPLMPRFLSDEVLARTNFVHGSDLSLKRNLGLLLGRLLGWERVLFLDDDITGVDAKRLPAAAALLDDGKLRAVGLRNTGYPDNSVVCHAYRAIGAQQSSFIGGGAMIVDPTRTRSFFPNIYNEDWFFLLGDGVPFGAAVAGTMVQRSYDPFATSGRAAGEELGDTLAEGLFWLLDCGLPLDSSDAGFWGDFLYRRRLLLDHVLSLVDVKIDSERAREPIKAALEAARGRSSDINPWLCAAFVDAWRADLVTWGRFVKRFRREIKLDDALAQLGLSHVAVRSTT